MDKKLSLLEGMDSYLPHVDGVINCMHNYCLNSYKKIDVLAIAPKYKNYEDNVPYNIKRCMSFQFPGLGYRYGQATKDRKFYKEIMQTKYDIVHVNSPFNMAKFAVKVARKQNIPVVATFHSNMKPIFKSIVKFDWFTNLLVRIVSRTYKKFDEVFVCSPLVAEQCREFGYKGKISYLPFGTDIPKSNDKEKLREEANKKLGLDKDTLMFIYVGRIEKLKRVDFILQALKVLKDKGIKFKFYAVGKGTTMDKFVKFSNKLGFTNDEVVFTGFIDKNDFPLMYSRADLLLFPSLYDNFGLVKVEAAAFDTPGVFIKGSCAGYGVKDNVDGYLSEDTVEAFASKIEEAVSDREKLKEVGVNAGKDLYISWADCTDQFIDRLQEVKERFYKEQKEKNQKK